MRYVVELFHRHAPEFHAARQSHDTVWSSHTGELAHWHAPDGTTHTIPAGMVGVVIAEPTNDAEREMLADLQLPARFDAQSEADQ